MKPMSEDAGLHQGRNFTGRWWLLVAGMLACAGTFDARAEITRTQIIQLRQGWNAVFLEVYPEESVPETVFANAPVDIVASYYAPGSSAQFMTDPGVDLFKQAGWGVWYAATRPDAFLKTLHAINGQQPYLIHARNDYLWTVTGTVVLPETRWQPNAYNFVGFSLSAQAPPTFARFFAGSKAHQTSKIFRLVSGSWRRVSAPDAETMRAGEGFWIFCSGGSSYQGPFRVETLTRNGLVLGSVKTSITLRNLTGHPVTPTVEHVAVGAHPVPMSMVIQAVGGPGELVQSLAAPLPAGPWTQALPPMEGGAALRVPLEARVQDMRSVEHNSLLKITTDLGTESWIPVISFRPDLEEK